MNYYHFQDKELHNVAHFVSGMELFWAKEEKPMKTVPMGTEVGNALTDQPRHHWWNHCTTAALRSSLYSF
jgi:hypothetical protein